MLVIQDFRGTYASEGDFTPLMDDPADGADTINWIRQQPWCDGTVATFGTPCLGFTQWAAASQTPEGLVAIAPTMTSTDFTGKLVDVHPDGRAIYLTDGILQARYSGGLERSEQFEPEKVYEVTLDLSVTSNGFLPGHRIWLEVSSSNFPRYDRNTNTGGTIASETLADAVPATNRVLHGPDHPSRLVLPVIAR